MQNIGFEFNKRIFWSLHNETTYKANCRKLRDGESSGGVKTRKGLKDVTFDDIKNGVEMIKEGVAGGPVFTLEVAWPGLYSGLGYTHETGKNDEEVKTGFSFHYLTGVPYIPESSVKGILRSSFPMRYKNAGKRAAVEMTLNDILKALFPDKIIDMEKLELEIFGPASDDDPKTSPASRVRFGCAIPSTDNHDMVKIFSIDTITPHDHPLHEPVPLRTLAIRPGVKMDFYFIFNTSISPVLCDTEIKTLFEYLITEYGVGAKTNSGYGQFITNPTSDLNNDKGYLDFLDAEPGNNTVIKKAEFAHPESIKKGTQVLAEFVKEDPANRARKIFRIISPIAINVEVPLIYRDVLKNGKYILSISDFSKNTKKILAVSFVKQYHEN